MNFLLRLFKKEKHNIGVIRFGDNLVIPGREYFKDEKDIILLENYKKHYLEMLKNRAVVTTPYFNSKSLKEQMNMYIDLLLGLLMDNNNFCEYAPEELLVQIAKLKMYYDEMIVLKNEIILRLIALKEIKKEKRIPRHNKMALEEEINSLSVILEMFVYREASINIEIKNYFDVLTTRDLSEVDESLLNERLTRLLFLTKGIVDKNKLYDDIKLNVALLEKECEIYAYTHKEEALKLKESYCLNDESKILLFYEYGKDIFDHDFVKEFYLYKFNLLVTDINNSCNESPINVKDYGFPFYEEIIADKINNLDKSYYFNDLIDKNVDISEQLNGARKYLKNKEGIFNYEEILKNKYKLAFLVSLEKEKGIKDYFNKNIIDLTINHEWNKYINGFSGKFEDKVPLSTLCKLFVTDKNKHALYSIYEANRIENNLLIPYGVKRINLSLLSNEYIERIEKDVNSRKKYVFPNSLKSIRGAMDYFGYDFSNLYFPDGLEELMIGYNATIPSSVEKLDRCVDKHIGYIKFRDFKNSKIVNDKKKFIKFLVDFSEEIDTNMTNYHTPSKYSLEVQRKYRTGRFTTQDYNALFDKPYTIYVFKQKMLFTSLYFLDDDLDNPIVINGKDIELEFGKTKEYYYYSRRSKVNKEDLYGCADFNKIYEKIRRIIIEQSGYDIASREIVDNKKLIYDKKIIYFL